jgi:hypothetical protein
MVRDLLIRGMVAGLIGGLLCFGVAKVFGEPQVDRAISFEEAHAKAETAADRHEMPGMSEGNKDSGEVELVRKADGRVAYVYVRPSQRNSEEQGLSVRLGSKAAPPDLSKRLDAVVSSQ